MSWLDFAIILGFIFFLTLGYKRGLVLEIADLLCIVFGGLLAFRLYRPLAGGLHASAFKGFSLGFLEHACLYTIFFICSLIIFGFGFNLQRRMKEEGTLDKDFDQRVGLILSIFKGTIVLVLAVGLMFYNNAFPQRETNRLKRGPIVSATLGLSTPISPLIYVIAPADLAKDFIENGLSRKSAG